MVAWKFLAAERQLPTKATDFAEILNSEGEKVRTAPCEALQISLLAQCLLQKGLVPGVLLCDLKEDVERPLRVEDGLGVNCAGRGKVGAFLL